MISPWQRLNVTCNKSFKMLQQKFNYNNLARLSLTKPRPRGKGLAGGLAVVNRADYVISILEQFDLFVQIKLTENMSQTLNPLADRATFLSLTVHGCSDNIVVWP